MRWSEIVIFPRRKDKWVMMFTSKVRREENGLQVSLSLFEGIYLELGWFAKGKFGHKNPQTNAMIFGSDKSQEFQLFFLKYF